MAAAEAALPAGLDDDHELVVAADAISTELDDCARSICRGRATSVEDIRLLAEVCYWTQYGEAPLDGLEVQVVLAREGWDLGDEAVAALLRGIRGVLQAATRTQA